MTKWYLDFGIQAPNKEVVCVCVHARVSSTPVCVLYVSTNMYIFLTYLRMYMYEWEMAWGLRCLYVCCAWPDKCLEPYLQVSKVYFKFHVNIRIRWHNYFFWLWLQTWFFHHIASKYQSRNMLKAISTMILWHL